MTVEQELDLKKQELCKYKGYEQKLKSLEYKITDLERRIRSIKAQQLKDMPFNPFGAKDSNEAINELVDLKDQYVRWHKLTIQECKRIEDLINQVEDPIYNALLRYRYVNCMDWDVVADKLCCSKVYAHQLHNMAIQKIKIVYCS